MTRILDPQRLATLVAGFPRSPAYLGLRQALQELIGDGRIAVGTRLPSERNVAAALGLSRITVARAYSELVDAGFAVARQGAGTFASVPVDRRRAHDHALRPLEPVSPESGAFDFNCAASAATPGTAAGYERALAALPAYLGGDGYLPSGLPALRALIAGLYERRGLATEPSQIVVTTGALSGISIVARALSRPGDRILVETPVYPNAIEALRGGGGRLVASPLADPLGESGWDYEGIEATLRQTSPSLAYLIPDFQNPTGFLMPADGRERLAAALAASRTRAIIDETLQPTNLAEAAMPPPFASYSPDAITVGSLSKIFWGGLRVGWIRAPRDLVARIIQARVHVDLGGSLFDQLVALELLGDEVVLAGRRDALRQQRDALVAALRGHLPDWRFRVPRGGLSLWARLPQGSATQLAARLEADNVFLAPGPVFSVEGGGDQWLRLPFARPVADLVAGVERIASAPGGATVMRRAGEPAARVLIA